MIRGLLMWLAWSTSGVALAQYGTVFGRVTDRNGEPIEAATIVTSNPDVGAVTNADGRYEMRMAPGKYTVTFSHVQYRTRSVTLYVNLGAFIHYDVKMREDIRQLNPVEITGDNLKPDEQVGPVTQLEAISARRLPSAFGDFSKILVTLPGVASNNELSSAYSVRGGNFDENLVYVNDIPVYRPFLANAGRQEGLSFVNPDMVSHISFYAGGWEPKYGDKLSSSLNILYREPTHTSGQVTLGLLGGTGSMEHQFNERFSMVTGVRHRDSRYLLGTLETKGQYFPTYTDVQSMLTFDLTDKESEQRNKTKLNWLLYYGRNRYLTRPESLTTEFGSVQANFRIQTAFAGQEILNYDVYQTGVNLSHIWTDRWLSRFIVSAVHTREREYYDVEGFYRLCDIDNNPGSPQFDNCVLVRGLGTHYNYGRNQLRASLLSVETRQEHLLSTNHLFEWGLGVSLNAIKDQINEYAFTDSADYVLLHHSVFNSLSLLTRNYTGFVQSTVFMADSAHAITTGVRFNYWDYTGQLIASPRISYRFKPAGWQKPTIFRLSVGWYQQFPFYRELRDFEGNLRENVGPQRSVHFIGSMERILTLWGRPFYFTSEAYYKYLYDMIPYDIDNVRLRYFAENDAFGYAAGLDFRINGEFIPGTQSWFSLGLLKTGENITGDDKNYIRRPTDQHINMAIFFEDHMAGDPTLRINLNLVYGSGYPVGPPNDLRSRNVFNGDAYYRVDIALSKQFVLTERKAKNIWLRAEILNALGADNTLSYSWIQDFNGNQFAVPNSLSARFLNLKVSVDF
jgi:hypothetical protein